MHYYIRCGKVKYHEILQNKLVFECMIAKNKYMYI